MELFGVGLPEAGLVFVLALILIGPERFPEMARQAGRWYRTARAFTDAVMVDVRSAVDEIEDEIADKNDGLRPIRELQDIQREFTQIGEDAVAAAGDTGDTGDTGEARIALDGEAAAPSADDIEDGPPVDGAAQPSVERERTGTGGA